MSATKAITLRLDPGDHERLEVEAKRLGLPPATLARVYVRAGLQSENPAATERARHAGLAALNRLAKLRDTLPDNDSPVDVVQIIAAGREERDRRLGR